MKKVIPFVAALAVCSPAIANERPTNIKVFDHNKTIVKEVPVQGQKCGSVKVPIYEDVYVQGDAGAGALTGMIIGGLLGKGATGDKDGAAAGAVLGGIIGADKGSRPRTERRVVGHEWVRQCNQVVNYEYQETTVYSHSTIRFFLDGKRYVLEFQR